MLCHAFRRDPDPQFFVSPPPGPREQPKKSKAHDLVVALRKQNHSVYEISEALQERAMPLSPTAVREVLRAEGFAALPRRLDEERPARPGPTRGAGGRCARVRARPGHTLHHARGRAVLVPARSGAARGRGAGGDGQVAGLANDPSVARPTRRARAQALVDRAQEPRHGAGRRPGLGPVLRPERDPEEELPQPSTPRASTTPGPRALLAAWHRAVADDGLFRAPPSTSTSTPCPTTGRTRRSSATTSRCAAVRSPRCSPSWRRTPRAARSAIPMPICAGAKRPRRSSASSPSGSSTTARHPRHLVFDSRLTTYAHLARLDAVGITFITLRRRSARLLAEIAALAPSAWRRVTLDVPARKYKTPRVFEQPVDTRRRHVPSAVRPRSRARGADDPAHQRPARAPTAKLITRYAQRMLIENALSDAVRFFHMDALSSAVGLKVDFDMALLVIASGLYRLLARRMRGYADAQARHIFRDLIDTPADVTISEREVQVHFHRRAHLPIIIASGILDAPVSVPWWDNHTLHMSA